MTTGSVVRDGRSSLLLAGHTHYTGTYFSKSWNGGDLPAGMGDSGKDKVGAKQRRSRPDFRLFENQHPYSLDIIDYEDSKLQYEFVNEPDKGTFDGTLLGSFGSSIPPEDPGIWQSNWDIDLFLKLREEVSGSDFSASVFLGEANQTISMIGSSAARLYRGYKAARRLDVRGVASALGCKSLRTSPKDASNLWLEYNYGWRPLLQDTEAAAKALANYLHRPIVQVVRARIRKRFSAPGPSHGYWSQPCETTYRGQIVCYQSAASASLTFDTMLTSLPSVGWELVPFSFVADWFIPIGDYLSAVAFATSGSRCFVITKTTTFKVTGIGSGSIYKVTPGTNHRIFSFSLRRAVSQDLTVPLPSFKGWSQVPTWRKAITSIALLIQNFSGSPERAPRLPPLRR